jgi:hypothetical protein
MTKRSLTYLVRLGVFTSATVLALAARPLIERDKDRDRDDAKRGREHAMQIPTGQYVSPDVIRDAVIQPLNPGLSGYPDFVAGEAVKSQLSSDGTALAILTAGQNSLYKPDGTVDAANSTQFIFLYNVDGANQARPLLTQVIQQPNSHVGLVFSTDGKTLCAAGGNDDAVYVYTKSGATFTAATPIALGHFPPGATGSARNKGVGLGVQTTPAASASPPTARRSSSPTTTTTRSA